jgi:hypothetical protein
VYQTEAPNGVARGAAHRSHSRSRGGPRQAAALIRVPRHAAPVPATV